MVGAWLRLEPHWFEAVASKLGSPIYGQLDSRRAEICAYPQDAIGGSTHTPLSTSVAKGDRDEDIDPCQSFPGDMTAPQVIDNLSALAKTPKKIQILSGVISCGRVVVLFVTSILDRF